MLMEQTADTSVDMDDAGRPMYVFLNTFYIVFYLMIV